jgi:beta-lactamase regulating signal transducer with metallopeptidase domain
MTILALIKATCVLLAALVGVRVAHRARASVRHAVLASSFAVLAALPLASAVLPAVALPVLPRSAPLLMPTSTEGVRPPDAERTPPERGTQHVDVAATGVASAPASSPRVSAASVTFGIWLAGAAVVLLSLGHGLYRMQRLRHSALPCLATRPPFPALAHAVGVTRAVDLSVHEDLNTPITCGLVRPAIVLPPDAPQWPQAALTRALVHELEHVKRRDWAVQVLAYVVCAIYWFHPLVWIAYRQLCLLAEHACDDAVLTREEDTTYADQLVTLARRVTARPAVAVIGLAQRCDLAARISAVLDDTRARGPAGALRTTAIAATAIALLATVAPLHVVAAEEAPAEALTADARDPTAVEHTPVAGAATGARPQPTGRERPSRLDRAFVEAAHDGDLDDVRDLLDRGANVNAAVVGDGSALIGAAGDGDMARVRLLLDRGADVNLAVAGDGAPLIMAARGGHLAIVQLLLDRGATVDLVVPSDENALIQASGTGHLDVVRLLVAHGADVNTRLWAPRGFNRLDGQWRSPLSMALAGGHRAVVEFLRASGAVE